MLKEFHDSNIEFELHKLNYNNSLVVGLAYSLAQIIMSRKFRTKLT